MEIVSKLKYTKPKITVTKLKIDLFFPNYENMDGLYADCCADYNCLSAYCNSCSSLCV